MGKKLLMMLLCLGLVFGMLAGCGGTEDGSGSDTEEGGGGSEDPDAEKEEPVSLRAVMFGSAGDRNTEFFENEFHDRVLEELNIDMKIEFLPWGSEDQVGTMLASGEKFAFYSAITRPNFANWGKSGFFATIDEEMIEELAPAYLEARMDYGFETSKYQGDIVVLPVGAIAYSGVLDNFVIRNDILNKVGWDVSEIENYDDLVEAVKAVKAEFPDMEILYNMDHIGKGLECVYAPNGEIFQNDRLASIVAFNLADPESDEVISWLESDYFGELCKILEDWYAMGFTEPDQLIDYTIYENAWQSGNCLMGAGALDRIYKHTELNNYNGGDEDIQYLSLDDGPTVLVKDYDWGWSISAEDQENVEHWLRFFNWMYESKENYMFCLYGVEGEDYTLSEAGVPQPITKDEFFASWMHRTLFYEPLSPEEYDEAEIEEYMSMDKTAIISKTSGFVFDSTPVEVESSAISTIVTEKVQPIAFGFGNYEEDFPAVLEELKAAGLDKYIEEYQRQFSEFMANK